MPIRGLDHVAITVADQERALAFYRDVLSAEILWEAEWRAGKLPIFSARVGGNVINIHAAASPGSPRAENPTVGAGDLCFRWDGPIDAAVRLLAEKGVAVEEGPVRRPAADGTWGASVYFRDPDGNLLELLTTDGAGEAGW
ncbi:MAG: VOC family protein [Minwuiales bacterium]|nr:VOC family protein [Minwuiales bacterium]